ncbi:MAG TPA: class I SAM-dependent methyltransferase [Candidatus Nanopelagicales bacterium]|nr:class I SAM-dependent methyltransferase [Candidatus Nanopelagicales bacterium]
MTEPYWELVHAGKDVDDVSWWQPHDAVWVDLVESTGAPTSARIADVGSGSSTLVDALLSRGYRDITLLDVSATALQRAVERVQLEYGPKAEGVRAMIGDVTTTILEPPVDVWFDRAVFHFLTEPEDVAAYVLALRAGLRRGGYAVVSTYALDGPDTCSGLPVTRYDAESLIVALDARAWTVIRAERREHVTPWDAVQPFTTVVLHRPE